MTSEQHDMLRLFFRISGYGPSEILALNFETRLVMTMNGGIYKVGRASVEWVKGPALEPEERD